MDTDVLGMMSYKEAWQYFMSINPNSTDEAKNNERLEILAHGCIGYTCLMLGKKPRLIFSKAVSSCYATLSEAQSERKNMRDHGTCCKKLTANGTPAEPRIYGVHLNVGVRFDKAGNKAIVDRVVIGNQIITLNYMSEFVAANPDCQGLKQYFENVGEGNYLIAMSKLVYMQANETSGMVKLPGPFDFGYLEDGDQYVTCATHDNGVNNPATYKKMSLEEWRSNIGGEGQYASEIWCVACNDDTVDGMFHHNENLNTNLSSY